VWLGSKERHEWLIVVVSTGVAAGKPVRSLVHVSYSAGESLLYSAIHMHTLLYLV